MNVTSGKKLVTILGATGSIGVSTLSVIRQQKERYDVFALSAHSNIDLLVSQCRTFQPKYLVASDPDMYESLKQKIETVVADVTILSGSEGLSQVVSDDDVDIVVSGIVGAAGLGSTHQAIYSGKTVLVANKEPLVMAGDLLVSLAKKHGATILPVDSEHNAIFQCLSDLSPRSYANQGIYKILLTASGGPFLLTPLAEFESITVAEAIKHPKWKMGRKISIDSATMMNKGLEVIEAHYLFDAPLKAIEVVIHPQSIVHSMVQYVDGSTLAQLANPDMRIPIGHALNYPNRVHLDVPPLSVKDLTTLEFSEPELNRFPCLPLAYQALSEGRSSAIALNASNEVVVNAFLKDKIEFSEISGYIDSVLSLFVAPNPSSIEEIIEADEAVRAYTLELIRKSKSSDFSRL
ncbi:MAG: 1-deoxy-D-xylulose-5-phosphate reductoisomerase [Betaproteobacteria bacterium]|nr:1-deoxy-D-xylulose-5-phosphate reductoisomerase [Betaproteobacteria bacterium]